MPKRPELSFTLFKSILKQIIIDFDLITRKSENGNIRFYFKEKELTFCPICAVAFFQSGYLYQDHEVRKAAAVINLPLKLLKIIVYFADGKRNQNKYYKKQLSFITK
jgi:hypothetical protein